MENLNIFLYGLSGAGKDTISDYLRDEYGYLKLRIAGTIKQYVYETNGFKNMEEFENSKRTNPEVRLRHNTFGNQYDKEGIELSNKEASINRLNDLINHTALEFEIMRGMEYADICIVDVRTFEEAQILLNAGFIGIFLTRQNKKEFAKSDHKTEQGLIANKNILNLPNRRNIYVVRNHDNNGKDEYGWFTDENNQRIFETYSTDYSNENLLEVVDYCINNQLQIIREER